MVMTILSPLPQSLQKIKEDWKNVLLEAGLVLEMHTPSQPAVEGVEAFGTPSTGILDIDMLAGTTFDPDTSDTNRSSIAVLAEFDSKRALFAADAHVDVLSSGLARFQQNRTTQLDLIKISHHGAQGTTSRELIEALNCPRYLFSSNGANFSHPHAEAVSRVIVGSTQEPELIFNYKGDRNRAWEDIAKLNIGHTFFTTYPASGEEGIAVDL
jgi:beta-lactamase superfamily II metal-dependent hydrolase